MTLQQLKYVVEVAERGSITEAAKSFLLRSRAFLPPYAIWRKKRERSSFCGTVGVSC